MGENFRPKQSPEDMSHVESEFLTVREQLTKLGFPETSEMMELRVQVTQAISQADEFRLPEETTEDYHQRIITAFAEPYHKLAEAQTDQTTDQDLYNRQQLQLMLNMASIWLDAGKTENFIDELYSAASNAEQMGFEEEYNQIYDIIDLVTADPAGDA